MFTGYLWGLNHVEFFTLIEIKSSVSLKQYSINLLPFTVEWINVRITVTVKKFEWLHAEWCSLFVNSLKKLYILSSSNSTQTFLCNVSAFIKVMCMFFPPLSHARYLNLIYITYSFIVFYISVNQIRGSWFNL